MSEIQTHTLPAPGVTLTYDVRGDADGQTPLLLIGSPMGADGFVTLASHFQDRLVVTYDPRGVGRSARSDGSGELGPEDHAGDLARIIEALGGQAVDIFATSGGAVNALALVSRRPELVRVLVAHEPPLARLLPDSDAALAASADIYETYQAYGFGPAMAKFIALTSWQGEIPADYTSQPSPGPAAFGLPTEDDGSRDDPLVGQNMRGCSSYQPDLDAISAASTEIAVAAGVESEGQMAARAAAALAERLGVELTRFPSHHAGFLGGEYGMSGDPSGFAAALRGALDASVPASGR